MLPNLGSEQNMAGEPGSSHPDLVQDVAEQSNLTRSQFLIWLGQTLAPDAPLYNMIQTFTFETALDVQVFRAAFQSLIDSSDALRTVIDVVDGVPQQRVLVDLKYGLEWVDLSGHTEPEEAYRNWLDDRRVRLHDLSTRLFDSALVQQGPSRFTWFMNQHHLITDGWSFLLVYQRMARLYEQLLLEREPSLRPLPSYADYVQYERTFRTSRQLTRAEKYWAGKMAVPAQPVSFYDLAPGLPTHRTERVVCDLGVERTSRLKDIAAENGIQTLNPEFSLYNLFITLFAAYLHRISGNNSITLGSPFHNRPTPAFKETIGVFIEVCPLRVEVNETDTFYTLHRKVMRETMTVLMNALPGTSRAEFNRAYSVLLNFVNVTFPPFAGIQPRVEWVHSGYGDRDHALRLQIHDFNATGSYELHFDFNTQVFTTEQRALAVQHFLRVVDAFIEDRGMPIQNVDLLTAAERTLLLEDFNRTEAAYPSNKTIIDLFEDQVSRTPQAPAIRVGKRIYSYSHLNHRANQLAHYLRGQGLQPGSLAAIIMEHSLEVVVAILGVLKTGGTYVPIDPADPPDRIKAILSDLGVSPLVMTQPHLSEGFVGLNIRLVVVEDSLYSEIEPGNVQQPYALREDLAYIIYTSGSTGKPKGVMIQHLSLVNYIWWARVHYLKDQAWDFPLFSSLSFDLTVTSLFTPLISGGQIVVYPEERAERGMSILKVFEEDAVDIVKLTPAHLSLLRGMDLSRSRIKALILGGEDLKTELARSISESFNHQVAIYNEYGPTEATVGCMIHRFDPETDIDTSVPIGRPIHNAQVYILDNNLQPVPPGIVGEMCIGGHGIAREYFRRPELTESKFVENSMKPGSTLYRTGDLARWTPDGRMQFLGRKDHQVKIKGYRIELGEIESHLLEHPKIETAVVTAFQADVRSADKITRWCIRCSLPDNYPGAVFDSAGVCNTCRDFSELKDRFSAYFRTSADLQHLVEQAKQSANGSYDCLVLYSGGKDSTYMLYQLVREYGLRPLVFNLDNGYISEEAKENIRKTTSLLGVDLIFGQTPHMKAVFADSLKRHSNVCDGCFKVIYTLSINLARQKGIKYIFTGLSRGQLFETRLSDMFQARIFDPKEIDRTVLAARRAYHRVDDAVKQLMDVKIFEDERVFDEVQLVDFYRYTDVSLGEMYRYLDQEAAWVRPSDTGRSTNCLINDAGIYIHKKERGFHNYALPYSWDVRVGHKTTSETIHELNDDIDMSRVRRILSDIGYDENEKAAQRADKRLVAYYVSRPALSSSDLRQYLSSRLPEYMIPADFIQLDAMPLTTNGKIDRAALPAPDSTRKSAITEHVAPVSENERKLASVWSAVFRLPEIGIYDNFFELGGDSIISIQIVTKAKQVGLHFTPRDLFEKQTIAHLAAVIRSDQNVFAEQGLVTGRVPLTPIQHWFFEQELLQPQHWNQSLWLDVPASVHREALQRAFAHLPKQHDILRARYYRASNGTWQQSIAADDLPSLLEFHDLSGLNTEDQEVFIQDRGKELEGTLNLEEGPLLKAALFAMSPDRPMRLFVTIHHLVVDGVSWQPLLSDWETAYHQLRQNQAVRLPHKTTSFKTWAEKLAAFAQSSELEAELEYWRSNSVDQLPAAGAEHGRTSSSVSTASCTLTETSTTTLLKEVHEAYNTHVQDLLLAAWAQAYRDWTGARTASLVLEGHGRETEIFNDVDLSHTVGWFATHYPLHIRVPEKWEPKTLLTGVKEQLRRVPHHGIGYGILRYLNAEKPLVSDPTPQVLFNYLGQFERALPSSELFQLVQPLQTGYGPRNRRTHDLEVNSFIRNEQLYIHLVYSTGQFTDESMNALASGFRDRLEALITHCLTPDAGGHTPSDFSLANLNDEQFNRLSNLLNALDDE